MSSTLASEAESEAYSSEEHEREEELKKRRLSSASLYEQRLEMAREEFGLEDLSLPSHFDLPRGELKLTPTELLAAEAGQKVRFTVTLDRPAAGAELLVTLPEAWVKTPASGIRPSQPPVLTDSAGGHAELDRSGRTVELAFPAGRAGDSAAFEITDNGIPAGTYELPLTWRYPSGRTQRAGTAKVVFIAPVREESEFVEENPWSRLTTSTELNVTGDSSEQSEAFVAVTPGNINRAAIGINDSTVAAWVTDSGGDSWTKRTLPSILDVPGSGTNQTSSLCCDPMFAADALGNIWYGVLTRGALNPSRIAVNRVGADTTSFQTVSTALPIRTGSATDVVQDKPMMTIDNTPSSPTYGRLYVVWNEPSSGSVIVVISQCDTRPGGVANAAYCDNADNWTTPAAVTVTRSGGTVTDRASSFIYADVAVAPDGKVYVVWWDYSATNAIQADVCDPVTSTCSSNTGWGNGLKTVALLDSTGSVPVPFACPILAQPGGRPGTAPSIEIDRSGGSNNGRVYVSWGDLRTGSGTTRCTGSTAPAATHLTWDTFVASASGAIPGGSDRSPSVGTRLLNDNETPDGDDWFSWLAVDQTSGQAWADFYSTRNDSTRKKADFYLRAIYPSSSSHQLGSLIQTTSAQSDYSADACCTFSNEYGDYEGLDATSGYAYATWSDKRTGSDGEAYAAIYPISASPPIATTTTTTPAPTTTTTAPTETTTTTQPAGPSRIAVTKKQTTKKGKIKVSFDATSAADSAGTLFAYSWLFGDQGKKRVTAPGLATHTYDCAGTYSTAVTVTDTAGTQTSLAKSLSLSFPSSVSKTYRGLKLSPKLSGKGSKLRVKLVDKATTSRARKLKIASVTFSIDGKRSKSGKPKKRGRDHKLAITAKLAGSGKKIKLKSCFYA